MSKGREPWWPRCLTCGQWLNSARMIELAWLGLLADICEVCELREDLESLPVLGRDGAA